MIKYKKLILACALLGTPVWATCEDKLSEAWRHASDLLDYEERLYSARQRPRYVPDSHVVAVARQAEDFLAQHPLSTADLRELLLAVVQANFSYMQSSYDSARFDVLLGIRYESTEAAVSNTQYETGAVWKGLSRHALQTTYREAYDLFKRLQAPAGSVAYDFGAGYGRVVVGGAFAAPELRFKAIELTEARAENIRVAAKRLQLENIEVLQRDVRTVDFSDGDIFFLYNPFPDILPDVGRLLCNLAARKKLSIVLRATPGEVFRNCSHLRASSVILPSNYSTYIYESK